MSLVLHYRLQENTSADVGTEYVSGVNNAVNSNVTSTVDATYGTVANFDNHPDGHAVEFQHERLRGRRCLRLFTAEQGHEVTAAGPH
jgi:hypothetical protein